MPVLPDSRGLREEIERCWARRLLATYPEEGAAFFGGQADPFRNPVGSVMSDGLGALTRLLAAPEGEASRDAAREALEPMLRVRAVQEFTPSEAVGFVFLAKRAVRQAAEARGVVLEPGQLGAIDRLVDEFALVAFDLYEASRRRLERARRREQQRRTERLVALAERLGLPEAAQPPTHESPQGGC